MELRAAAAGVLPDRDYLLTQGAMLDCVLETRIVSTVAGMTSCHLTRDVYSTSGRVVLLDRGSRVVGRYQGGMQQGDTRIFVVWTRVETPTGVVVELQSPGTGPLGEAGVGGYVDTHFWDRFGAAILLSLIEGGVDAAAARAAGDVAGNEHQRREHRERDEGGHRAVDGADHQHPAASREEPGRADRHLRRAGPRLPVRLWARARRPHRTVAGRHATRRSASSCGRSSLTSHDAR